MNRQKIDPLLQAEIERSESEQAIPLILRLDVSRGLQPLLSAGRTVAAVRYEYRLLPMAALLATPGQIYALRDDPAIDRLWYDLPVQVCLDFSAPLIQAPRVWGAGVTGRGVRVALLDTGLDVAHPDLRGRVVGSAVFAGDNLLDRHGHGTHVAGIIGGNGSASAGRYRGVAPDVTFLVARVLDDRGAGWSSDVMAGLDWAVMQGARVANLSLSSGHYGDGSDALSLFCDATVQQGVVVCTAAGNDGPASHTIGAPGCSRQALTVGASTDADGIAEFSAHGPTADGRIKPDVIFPGVLITSTRARGASMGASLGDYYTEASGTSMATAHASGAAALLLEADPSLTPAEVKARLLSGAKDLGRNAQMQGAGRGDAYAAFRVGGTAGDWAGDAAGGGLRSPRMAEAPFPLTAATPARQRPPRTLSRGLWLAGLALAALMLCLCSVLILLGGLDSALRVLETRAITPTPALNVLLRQDYANPDPAWPTNENEQEQRGLAEGRFYLIARQPQSLLSQVVPGRYDNVVIEVEAGQTDGPAGGAYGLILRQRDSSNFYYVGLTSQGSYSFARLVSGQWQEIIPWTPAEAILKVGYLNRLRVEAQGKQFKVIVNGQVLAAVEDGTFDTGTVALFAASFEQGGVRIDFDNLTIWAAAPN